MEKEAIKTHEDLAVYQLAFSAAMTIFKISKKFPVEEKYSLTDQIRRSGAFWDVRSLAEAWRKRRYVPELRQQRRAASAGTESRASIQYSWILGKVRQGRQGGLRGQGGSVEKEAIKTHEDLAVYQLAFSAAMTIFEISKKFPVEEKYSLTDQIRRSSRSVCAVFGRGLA